MWGEHRERCVLCLSGSWGAGGGIKTPLPHPKTSDICIGANLHSRSLCWYVVASSSSAAAAVSWF